MYKVRNGLGKGWSLLRWDSGQLSAGFRVAFGGVRSDVWWCLKQLWAGFEPWAMFTAALGEVLSNLEHGSEWP